MGRHAFIGAQVAVDEINGSGGVLGRSFQLIREEEASPSLSAQRARKLIQKDRVHALTGTMDSTSALAVGDEAQRLKVPFLNTGANSDEIRSLRCHPYVFSVEASNTQYVSAITTWLLQQPELMRWYFLTSDYPFGRDLLTISEKLLLKAGRSPVGSDLIPTHTTDFNPSLQKVRAANPDLVFHNFVGTDQTNFLKQFRESGLEIEVAGGLIETSLVWPTGSETLRGYFPLLWWHELRAPGASDFVVAFRKRTGVPPENQAWADYTAIKALAEGIRKMGTTDGMALVKGLEGHQFESLKGRPLYFRPWDHQLIMPLYAARAKEKAEMKDRWDIFEVLSEEPQPGKSMEAIAMSREESACRL
jgi:branched-chain amino acid transport system substrate-binding protein